MSRVERRGAQKGLFDDAPTFAPAGRQTRVEEGGATTPTPEPQSAPAPSLARRRRRRKCDVCANKGVMKVAKIVVTMTLANGATYERVMPEHYTKEIICPECEGDCLLAE